MLIKSAYLRLIIYFICAVCIYDIYCTVNLSDSLYDNELNPIAKTLISQSEVLFFLQDTNKPYVKVIYTDVSKLVLFKVLGLVASLEIFDWLMQSENKKVAQISILSIFLFQLILLCCLNT